MKVDFPDSPVPKNQLTKYDWRVIIDHFESDFYTKYD